MNTHLNKEELAVNRTVHFALGLGILICSIWAALMIAAGAYGLSLRFLWSGPHILLEPNPKQLKDLLSIGIGGVIGITITVFGFWCAFLRFRCARSYSKKIKELEEHPTSNATEN